MSGGDFGSLAGAFTGGLNVCAIGAVVAGIAGLTILGIPVGAFIVVLP